MATKKTPKKTTATQQPEKSAAVKAAVKAAAKAVADAPAEMTQAQIQADANARLEAFKLGLQALMDQHRCQIVAAVNPPKPIGTPNGAPSCEMVMSCRWDILVEA